MSEAKPCPFCGTRVDLTDQDTLYPTGTYWREHPEGYRSYHGFYERQEGDGMCWKLSCCSTGGGCDATIYGDSKEDALAKWNRRVE